MPSPEAQQMVEMSKRLDEINDYDDPKPNEEADGIRDKMDAIWWDLTPEDRTWIEEEVYKSRS